MTTLYYAPSTKGFYDSGVNGTNVPDDAVVITPIQYAALLAGVNSGQVITIVSGIPTISMPTPTPVQAGNAALAAGINISSTSTPALNGVFALNEQSQNDINAVSTYIVINGTFPQGQSTTYWAQQSGAIIEFPSVAVFKAFATAVADYVDAIEDYQNSGGEVGSLPSQNVTII